MNDPRANRRRHVLPALPYACASLEPHIDARTLLLHHDKHHAAYVNNLNSTLENYPELQEYTALWLLHNLNAVPKKIRTAVRNNAGGHVNHSLFWQVMDPGGGVPTGELADAIERDFHSFEQFKDQFVEAGSKHFGSGWVWLVSVEQDGGKLQIYTTSGHDYPLIQGHCPVLVNDLWEHAYYLNYENRRGDYLQGWWAVVNWGEVARRFEHSAQTAVQDWEDEGGLVLKTASETLRPI